MRNAKNHLTQFLLKYSQNTSKEGIIMMKLIISICLFLPLITQAKEFIVQISDGMRPSAELLKHSVRQFKALGSHYLIVDSDQAESFQLFLEVNHIEENASVSTFDESYFHANQGDFHKQWALQNKGNNEPVSTSKMSPLQGVVGADLNMLETWKLTKGSKQIVIAVIDTGVNYQHDELKENIWVNQMEKNGRPWVDDDGNGFVDDKYGYDFVQNDAKPLDQNGHGTHCAGIIGASHHTGKIQGAMAEVSIMPVRMMDKNGRGSIEQAIKAIGYAIDNGAHILSNSWGSRKYSKLLEELLIKANQQGVIVVAAAGNARFNNNDTDPTYPASYQAANVISVAAYNAQERHASYSTFGPTSVHVAAPGTNILSTYIRKRRWSKEIYKVASGTSMATPYVAAVLGLYLSYHGVKKTPQELRDLLIESSIPVENMKGMNVSNGRIDAFHFLSRQ